MIRIPWPEYIDLKYWAANIVFYYPNEPLPILADETKWQEWGAILSSTGVFRLAGVPSPFNIKKGQKQNSFENWQEWAKTVYKIMAVERAPNN